jgi:hypothetical protein
MVDNTFSVFFLYMKVADQENTEMCFFCGMLLLCKYDIFYT